jgi:hypothetical protein
LRLSKLAERAADTEPVPAIAQRDLWLRNNNARQSPFAGDHDRLTLSAN